MNKFTQRAPFLICILFLTSFNPIKGQVNVQDSLILIDVYNSISGINWNLSNPVNSWLGITTANDRVTKVSFGGSINGPLPSSIGGLSELKELNIVSTVTGSIPDSIGYLVKLEKLRLSNNDLEGEIPSSIGNLINLKELRLTGNELSGAIPSSIGNMSNLVKLELGDNNISGTIPSVIGNLVSLEELDLADNNLDSLLPTSIGNCTALVELELSENNLSGAIPSSIGNLSNLEYLLINDNSFSGALPATITGLTNLKQIRARSNNLSGIIPEGIGALSSLQELWLHNNQLSGGIPNSIGNLSSLKNLYLGFNQLSGPIPDLCGLNSILNIELYVNNLTGPLPEGIGCLSTMKIFAADNNPLGGEIPQTICNLTNLENLSLENCQLSGELPDCFEKMQALENLRLKDNNISGTLPQSLGSLNTSNIDNIVLSNNNLSGCLPSSLFNLCGYASLQLIGNPNFNSNSFVNFCQDSVGVCNYIYKHQTFDKINQDTISIASGYNTDAHIFAVAGDNSVSSILQLDFFAGFIEDYNELTFNLSHSVDQSKTRTGEIMDVEIDGSFINLYYKHPDWQYANKLIDTVMLNISDPDVQIDFNIIIHRPPLLNVHGLWSNSSAFGQLKQNLVDNSIYYAWQIRNVDYEATNDWSFHDNVNRIPLNASLLLQEYFEKSVAAGAVDVVGHSMGGILSRLYIQSPLYRDDIHKLITLNTPHSGSQLGDWLFDPNIDPAIREAVCGIIEKSNLGDCDNGAVEELGTNNFMIDDVLNTNNRPAREVSVHHIATTFPIQQVLQSWQAAGFVTASPLIIFPSFLIDNYLADLFNNSQHDMVVQEESQLGGIDALASTLIVPQIHTGSPNNQNVIQSIKGLLGKEKSQNVFTSYLFDPVDINYTTPPVFLNKSKDQLTKGANEFLTIDPMIFDTTVVVGDSLFVPITGSLDIHSIVTVVDNDINEFYRIQVDSHSMSFYLPTDSLELGKHAIIAAGWDTISNVMVFDTSHFNLVLAQNFDSISISIIDEEIILGELRDFQVFGHLNNQDFDISKVDSLIYTSNNSRVVFLPQARLKADSVGVDSIVVSYQNISSNALKLNIISNSESGMSCANPQLLYSTGIYRNEEMNLLSECENCTLGATNSSWFSFSPNRYGVINISTCTSSTATRLWLYEGDCENLIVVDSSYNACDLNGTLSGSTIENFAVYPDKTYFLEWDNAFTDSSFLFNFEYNPLCPQWSILFVDSLNTPQRSGDNWNSAKGIVDAFDDCQLCPNVEEIWIKNGTYFPDTTDRTASFTPPANLTIYGGFTGAENSVANRDWINNKSILSGDIGLTDIIEDNSYHVIQIDSTIQNLVWDGFYIEHGNADGNGENESLGGAVFSKGILEMRNVIIQYNNSLVPGDIYISPTGEFIISGELWLKN